MAIELISSGFAQSLAPPDVVFMCEWESEGVKFYSCALIDPKFIDSPMFWQDMGIQLGFWLNARKRKHGEVANVHGYQHRPGDPGSAAGVSYYTDRIVRVQQAPEQRRREY